MLQQCTKKLQSAITEETTTKKLCKQHQNSLIDKYIMEGNTKLAKHIQGIQLAEEVKRVYQRCCAARNFDTEGGLSYLLVPSQPDDDPKTCQEWKQVDCPHEIKNRLTQHNQQHFGQSKGCTLTN